jgi:hypothetical protein
MVKPKQHATVERTARGMVAAERRAMQQAVVTGQTRKGKLAVTAVEAQQGVEVPGRFPGRRRREFCESASSWPQPSGTAPSVPWNACRMVSCRAVSPRAGGASLKTVPQPLEHAVLPPPSTVVPYSARLESMMRFIASKLPSLPPVKVSRMVSFHEAPLAVSAQMKPPWPRRRRMTRHKRRCWLPRRRKSCRIRRRRR